MTYIPATNSMGLSLLGFMQMFSKSMKKYQKFQMYLRKKRI